MSDKAIKKCPQCLTKYSVEWDIEEQDLEPLTCPFCGYEVEDEEYDDEAYEQAEDDSWN